MKFRAKVELSGKTATGIKVPAEALGKDAAARQAFDKLSNSHKQCWVLSITSAKAEQTRQRRVANAIEALRNG